MKLTPTEQKFYDALLELFPSEKHRAKIHPQYCIGRYHVDFYLEPDLVIEVDGRERWYKKHTTDYPRERYLISRGLVVMRFTNIEVEQNALKCANEAVDYMVSFRSIYLNENRSFKKALDEAKASFYKEISDNLPGQILTSVDYHVNKIIKNLIDDRIKKSA